MGNNSGKQHAYQQYYDSMNSTNNSTQSGQIDLSNLDPYSFINISKNFTWKELKDAYRNAALKTHPDKPGGNKVAFDFVTSCFETLAEDYNMRVSNKTHTELKMESQKTFEKMVNSDIPHPASIINKDEPFIQRFNKVFEDCRYVDEDVEYGYGGIMSNSTDKREEISINNIFKGQKVNSDTFNDTFNKNVPITKQVIKYKEPEALPMSKSLQFSEIGAKRPSDYSSGTENKTLQYTDYMVAYSGERLANPNDIKNVKEFKSVKEYQKYRDTKSKKELTDKEKRLLEKKKQDEENAEFNRLERIKKQNDAIAKAYEKANRLLIH